MSISCEQLSIVIPAKNEETGLAYLLPKLKALCADAEIIVVDDGSTDETYNVAHEHGVTVVQKLYSQGNGAAVKTGIRAATRKWTLLMDADGQHEPEWANEFLTLADGSSDMIVGARTIQSQASVGRAVANTFYNRFSSWMVGHLIEDLTSGFRLVKTEKIKEFLYLLPNGFSYPTTITMAFFRAGYSVRYESIHAQQRVDSGGGHIRPLKDGIRFLLIIFKIGVLYSPLKIFFPIAMFQGSLGFLYYAYSYFTSERFTNMTALLFSSALIIFLIGLVSEQITMLMYRKND